MKIVQLREGKPMTAPYQDYAAYVDPSLTVTDLGANYWGKFLSLEQNF